MTRSYKKNPIIKFGGGGKFYKDYANRTVRQRLKRTDYGISNGKSYRKMNNPWDIYDCIFRETKNEFYRHKEAEIKRAKALYGDDWETNLYSWYLDEQSWYKNYYRK